MILVHLTENITFKTWNHFRKLIILNFFFTSAQLHNLRCKMKHRIPAILWHNIKLNNGMCLLGFRQVWGFCSSLFLLSTIKLFFIFMWWNHIDKQVNFVVQHLQCKISCWSRCGSIDRTWTVGSQFVQPHFTGLENKLSICYALFGKVLNRAECSHKYLSMLQ